MLEGAPDPPGSPACARTLAARMPRSSTSARTRASAAVSSQRSVAAEVRPATTSSARRSAATADTAPSRARAVPTSPANDSSARPMSSRSSGPSTSNASRHRSPEVVDLVPGHLLQPARERVVGGQVGQVEQRFGAGDRDDVGRDSGCWRAPWASPRQRSQRRTGDRGSSPAERHRSPARSPRPGGVAPPRAARGAAHRTMYRRAGPRRSRPWPRRRAGSRHGGGTRSGTARRRPTARAGPRRHPVPGGGSRPRRRASPRSLSSAPWRAREREDRSGLRRARGERRRRRANAGRGDRRARRASRACGFGASPGCTPPRRSASPISPTSATRSWRSMFRPARTRRRARRRCSRRSRGSNATSGAAAGDAGVRASSTSTCSSSAAPGSPSTARRRPGQSRPKRILRRRHACSRSRIGTPGSGCSCSRRWPISRRGSFRPAGTGRSRRAAERERAAVEGPDAVRPIATWDADGRRWLRRQPRKRVSSAVSTAPPSGPRSTR